MVKVAVLITVYNRRDVTLNGLKTLYRAISNLGKDYYFDIYLTDDASTDGTGEAVMREFQNAKIIRGNGNLYWGGGMRLAWQSAIESGINYDYYLWFNDDSDLYGNALLTMFESASENHIVTGAFCDHNGNVSYGGRDSDNRIMEPKDHYQEVNMMNGNLVLIPAKIYDTIGNITPGLKHGGGDFDFGFRATKAGFKVVLSNRYVGIADRHDEYIPKYCSPELSFCKRWKVLHSPIYSPMEHFKFNYKYIGTASALKSYFISYAGVFFPLVYKRMKDSLNR